MNKFFWVAFALLAVISVVYCDDSNTSDEVLDKVKSKHLKKILKSKKNSLDEGLEKLEEKCPGVSEKLKAALKSFAECDDKVDESLTICSAIQSYTINCTQPLLTVIDECLPEKARGLPALGVKSALSVADYLCKLDGESIFELFNPCLYEDESESEEQSECEQKVFNKFDEFKDEVPSPADVCSAVTGLRSCVQSHTSQNCKNTKTRNVAVGLYDAMVQPCNSIGKN